MKQFAIIGLGNFGRYLASHLAQKGHEVLAMDINPVQVQEIKDLVSQAVVADATDPKVITSLNIREMDAAIVCIGSVLSASILATLNLKDAEVKNVIAKCVTEAHGRILKKVGATDIIFPEKDQGIALANRLHNPNIIDYLPFLEDYYIIEMAPPKSFIGKSLKELDLINKYGIQVVAIKEFVPDNLVMIPKAGFVLKDSDLLVLIGPNTSLEKLKKL